MAQKKPRDLCARGFDSHETALAVDRRITTRQTGETRNASGFRRGLQFAIEVYHFVALLSLKLILANCTYNYRFVKENEKILRVGLV